MVFSHIFTLNDTQIYGFCPPLASLTLQTCIAACIDNVAAWMLNAFKSIAAKPGED